MKTHPFRPWKICIWLSLYTIACTNNNDVPVETTGVARISINPEQQGEIPLTSLADSIAFVKLESKANTLIDFIDKVVFYNNSYYLLTAKGSAGLFCFTDTGKFKFKIDQQGSGPGEFLSPSDFCVNPHGIFITDRNAKKILHYDLNGKPVRDHALEFYPSSIADLGGVFLIRNGDCVDPTHPDNYYLTTDNFQVTDQFSTVCNVFDITILNRNFVCIGDGSNEFLIYAASVDTIYAYHKDRNKLTPKFSLDFAHLSTDQKLFRSTEFTLGPFKELMAKDYVLGPLDLALSGRFQLIKYTRGYSNNSPKPKKLLGIYDPDSGESCSISAFTLQGKHTLELPRTFTHDLSISILEPADVAIAETGVQQKAYGRFDDVDELVRHLNLDDNPVLVSYRWNGQKIADGVAFK